MRFAAEHIVMLVMMEVIYGVQMDVGLLMSASSQHRGAAVAFQQENEALKLALCERQRALDLDHSKWQATLIVAVWFQVS